MSLRLKHASIVWLEASRIYAGGQFYAFTDQSMLATITKVLQALPVAPTHWIVDDLMMPAMLLNHVTEVPKDAATRAEYFNWRYHQYLSPDVPHFVQAVMLEQDTWLLVGLPQEMMADWLKLAENAKRPISLLIPRWVWLYNRLAPTREVPGLLLSLAGSDNQHLTGSLIAWKDKLVLIRQWHDPMPIEQWHAERIMPTVAYLQRESCLPEELNIWGSTNWPECGIPTKIMQPEIPARELF